MAAVLAAAIAAVASLAGFGGIARADSPPTPVADAFAAQPCPGDTVFDPAHAVGAVPDLLQVFGQRLEEYNAGRPVVLYDSAGANGRNGTPPLCEVRYVASANDGAGGPVSTWMYCTDLYYHTCGGADSDGRLIDIDGDVIDGLSDVGSDNPRLFPDENKIVAYLIEHGHSYHGTGIYSEEGATNALADGTYDQRGALQTLIWCISDPVDSAPSGQAERDRAATCAANMDDAEQARILAMIPSTPDLQLSAAGPPSPLSPGDTATIAVVTNVFNQPITVTVSGPEGTLEVTGGDATLSGNTLIVAGDDPTQTAHVTLGFTADAAGTARLSASATPASINAISWNQSPGVSNDETPCQIFATFEDKSQATITAATEATFIAPPTSPPTSPPPTSPPTSPPPTSPPPTSPPSSSPTGSATPTPSRTGSAAPASSSASVPAPETSGSGAIASLTPRPPVSSPAADAPLPATGLPAVKLAGMAALLVGAGLVAVRMGSRRRRFLQ
jgi:hypothetical protein